MKSLFTTKRTALVLYAVLVVLPAAVFGGLHWHQLVTDHRAQVEALPLVADDAARRILAGIDDRLLALLESEQARPFYHYQETYYPEDTTDLAFVPSPLVQNEPPSEILAWFAYDYFDGEDADVELFAGPSGGPPRFDPQLAREVVRDLIERDLHERVELGWTRHDEIRVKKMSIHAAAVNRSPERDIDCLRGDLAELAVDNQIEVNLSNLHLRLVRSRDGTPCLLARRRVTIEQRLDAARLPDCFESLGYPTYLVQGLFIDLDWLFRRMPAAVAGQVLDGTQRFLLADHGPNAISPTDEVAAISLVDALAIEHGGAEDEELGVLKVAINTSDLERRFRGQAWRFLGVAGMMVVSLVVGMGLLVRSVRASLEQARRTENFVAAVTHELRTPVAAVRLYGEMLRDGWISNAEKKQDYLARIVREANRLDGLVDRVLEQRRLAEGAAEPRPGDLSAAVRECVPDLELSAGTYGGDLEFDLADDLPRVLLLPGAVHSILANLVENARKYAPVSRGGPDARRTEPILVRTHRAKGRVHLDVADRGPGIPEAERGRVFEAFYRVGDERTRTTAGTGLGLHLVALQARAMKGRASALPRPGGGSILRVTFRAAPRGSETDLEA